MTATGKANNRSHHKGHGGGAYVEAAPKPARAVTVDRPPLSRYYFDVIRPGQDWVSHPSELAHTEADAVEGLMHHYLYPGGMKWTSARLVRREWHEDGDFKSQRLPNRPTLTRKERATKPCCVNGSATEQWRSAISGAR